MRFAKPQSAKDRIILALDVDTIEEASELVEELKDYVGYFKVGLQLFTSCGYKPFEMIKEHDAKAFFDGKFHDIPNTVARACVNLLDKGVDFFDVHTSGGSKMLGTTVKYTKEYAKKYNLPEPAIIGVTLLSSFGQKTLTTELGVEKSLEAYVLNLAETAKKTGLDGVLASAAEAKEIRKHMGDDFMIICPAIRPTWSVVNDQIRVVTPTDAIKSGVDYMVIGRPITQAENRISAVKLIIDEIETASSLV